MRLQIYIGCIPYHPVVVKDRVGRRRYIIARNTPQLRRLISQIRKIDPAAKIAYFDESYALIRCRHWYKEKVIEFLNSHGVKTYITTGTIKKGKKIIEKLKARGR